MKNIRELLAVIWSLAFIIYIGYIIWHFGGNPATLSQVIGLITTLTGFLLGYYFGSMHKDKPTNSTTTEITNEKTES